MNHTVPITNSEFVRDMNSKAVVNTDVAGLTRYKELRRKSLLARQDTLETKKRLEEIEGEMVNLKKVVAELAVLRRKE